MKSALNHVAILTSSIESFLDKNSFSGGLLEEIEEFPSEGTRELYVGKGNQMGQLLLMQAIGDGPYKDALEKRGEGLHHIALDVTDIDAFTEQLSGSGWHIHPKSLKFYRENRQIFLCRTGVPVLIELQERKVFDDDSYLIDRLEFPFSSKLLEGLCCSRLFCGEAVKLLDAKGQPVCQL